MNLYPETSMNFRANQSSLPSGLAANATYQPPKPRLPPQIHEELINSSSVDPIVSPNRDHLSLPSFLPSPSRFIRQLPASPASLLFSPLTKRFDQEQTRQSPSSHFLSRVDDEENHLMEQIDQYCLRRQQYLQHNIELSMNISRWVLEHLIFYSVETLRRQAQVQSESSRAYLTPISAVQMIYIMKGQQGIGVLWKGCFSSLILTCAETMSDNLIEELAPFDYPSLRVKHVILKAISSFLLIPLYSVHLLRSIQSDLTIVNQWSPLTIFIEPFQRVVGIKTGFYARAFPLWYLISFSVPYFVTRHVLENFFHRSFHQYREKHFPSDERQTNVLETVDDIECQLIDTIPSLVNRSFLRLEACLFAGFLSNLLLYPYQTVMNRLFVQGTRTIVDNLDSSMAGCVPVNTRYLGFFDCCRTIWETEGSWGRGFFKGVGFFILKFGLIYGTAHCVKVLIERLAIIYTQNTSELSRFHHYVLSKQEQDQNLETL